MSIYARYILYTYVCTYVCYALDEIFCTRVYKKINIIHTYLCTFIHIYIHAWMNMYMYIYLYIYSTNTYTHKNMHIK